MKTMRKTKMKHKALAILMSLAMAFTMMPVMGTAVYADDPATNPAAINLGPDILGVGSNTSGAATVCMADKPWRVIGFGASTQGTPQVASSDGIMTLISADNIEKSIFNNDNAASNANHYGKSILKYKVEAVADTFSVGEKAGIVARDLASGSYEGENTDCIAGDPVTGALLWPLSTKEATTMDQYLRIAGPDNSQSYKDWWLRSPGIRLEYAAIVTSKGTIASGGSEVDIATGVRPAFHYDLESVILTSAAAGGKSATVGSDALAAPGMVTEDTDWKLTIKDDAHKNFTVNSVTTTDGKNLTIKYSGAVKGDNEYISAIIKDNKGLLRKYGKIARASDEKGATATVNIDGKMSKGDTLCIFNEQCNGNYETDFSSPLHDWEFASYGGTPVNGKNPGDSGYIKYYMNYKCTCHDPGNYEEHDGAHWTALERTDENRIEIINRPTCTEDGTYRYCFSGRGLNGQEYEKGIDTPYPAAGHQWDAGRVTSPPTATSAGVRTYTCTICEATRTQTIPKLGNDITITFELNGGMLDGKTDDVKVQAAAGQTITLPAPVREGYDFGCWTIRDDDNAGNADKYEAGAEYTVAGNQTFVANWIDQFENRGDVEVEGALVAAAKAKGKKGLTIKWTKVTEVNGYDIYLAKYKKGKKTTKMKKVATVKQGKKRSLTVKKGLDSGKAYKVYVKAYVYKDGVKKYVKTSPAVHVYTGGKAIKYTNAKSVTGKKKAVTLKKSKTYKIKAKVNKQTAGKKLMPKSIVKPLRYLSSDTSVATVTKAGEIRGKARGICTVYAISPNGVWKAIKVTVK